MTAVLYPSETQMCARCGRLRRVNNTRPPLTDMCRDCRRGEVAVLTDDWQGQGACRNYNPDLWFPLSSDRQYAEPAVRICRDECPVRVPCLEAALRRGENYGVWGGYTVGERRKIAQGRAERES